jgi:protein phosphatase 2C
MANTFKLETVATQGPREYMEDVYGSFELPNGYFVFCVFDGHNGIEVAQMCLIKAPILLAKIIDQGNNNVEDCLKKLYIELDKIALDECSPNTGCTACIVIMSDKHIWFSNCGDAMAMVKNKSGISYFVSEDHKVANEIDRLEKLGAIITNIGGCQRIFASLNIARSIGDHYLKKYVICDPYITSCSRDGIEWILIGSDGVWDAMLPHEITRELSKNKCLNNLAKTCYRRGSTDNIAILLCGFRPT